MNPYYQRNIPSPAKVYSFTLNNFVGGLNNRDQLPEQDQYTDVQNMSFTQDGLMEKRVGIQLFDEFKLDGEVTWLDEYRPHNDENMLIRGTPNKLYVGETLMRETSGQIFGINHMGKYVFCDSGGIWSYGKFDETAGTYVRIVGTQVTNYVLMQIVSPPEGFTPLGDEHTEGVRVLDFDQRKVWYEPCNQEIKDTFKQGNVVPTNPRFIVAREGRIFLAGDNKDDDNVWISDSGNPYYFPASLPMQLPPNSDRVSGLAVYNDAIVVGRRLDIHAITGDTNRTDAGLPVFRLKKVNSHFGFASQDSVVVAHNYLFFLGTDSQFYALRTVNDVGDNMATQVISKTVDIHIAPVNVKKEELWTASGAFYKDCYYCSIGDKIMVYHYLHQAWTVYDSIHARSFYNLLDMLLIGDKYGNVVTPSTNYLDLGKPYKGLWRSVWLDMGDPHTLKMFKDFFLISRSSRLYTSTVNLLFEIDHQNTGDSHDVTTNFSIYGRSKWGDRYINREVVESLPFMIYKRGRRVRITFWNSESIDGDVPTVADLVRYEGIYDGILVYVIDEDVLYTHENGNWHPVGPKEYDQGMCVMQLNGEYEFKWKR